MTQVNPKGDGTSAAMGHNDSNAMFLKRALDKLISEKDIKKRQYQPLRLACESALGQSLSLLSTQHPSPSLF